MRNSTTIWRWEVTTLAIMPTKTLKEAFAYPYLAFLSSPDSPVSTTTVVEVLALPPLYSISFLIPVCSQCRILPRTPLPTATLDLKYLKNSSCNQTSLNTFCSMAFLRNKVSLKQPSPFTGMQRFNSLNSHLQNSFISLHREQRLVWPAAKPGLEGAVGALH